MMPAVPVAMAMPIMLRAPSSRPSTTSRSAGARRAPATRRRWPRKNVDQRPLRHHQRDQRSTVAQKAESAGRQLLDHQAPDQHADRDQEVQPGLHRGPGLRQHAGCSTSMSCGQVGHGARPRGSAPDVERGDAGQPRIHGAAAPATPCTPAMHVVDDAQSRRSCPRGPSPSASIRSRHGAARARARTARRPSFSASRCTM